MTAPAPGAFLLWLVLDDELTTLNRAVGLLRRHRLALRGMTTLPGPEAARVTLAALVRADPGALDLLVNQLRKIVGVHGGAAVPLDQAPQPATPLTPEMTP